MIPGILHGRTLLLLGLAMGAAWAASCRPERRTEMTDEERTALQALESELSVLREAVDRRLERDSVAGMLLADTSDVLLGIRTSLLERALGEGARTYLDEVRLHVPSGDVVIHEKGDVGTDVGPVRVRAGTWDVRIVMRRLEALLQADSLRVAVADSTTLALVIWAEAREVVGEATIDFAWDAATVTSLVCRDFRVQETFSGTAPSRRYRLEGSMDFRPEGERIAARPRQTGGNLRVAPRPDPSSWGRVRGLLEEQNRFSRCGLALSPEGLEESLRRRLAEGFDFELPHTILEPIPLPAGVSERVSLDGEQRLLSVRPVTLRLLPYALWYGVSVRLRKEPAALEPAARR